MSSSTANAPTASTGDAMGSTIASGGSTTTTPSAQSFVARAMRTHGVPGKLQESDYTAKLSRVYARVEAKSKEQKEEVQNLLTYLAIVHGSGPTVEWSDIQFEPQGCRAVRMDQIIDDIITRKYSRRFFAWFADRAVVLHDSSPELQKVLQERAMRNGVPITETKAVIDFIPAGHGGSPGSLLYRSRAKYSAVQRTNGQGATVLDTTANQSSQVMHKYNTGDRVTVDDL